MTFTNRPSQLPILLKQLLVLAMSLGVYPTTARTTNAPCVLEAANAAAVAAGSCRHSSIGTKKTTQAFPAIDPIRRTRRGALERAVDFIEDLHLAEVVGADVELLTLPVEAPFFEEGDFADAFHGEEDGEQ